MVEVFGTGFGRTGTHSLKTALEQLGFGPCHHMLVMLQHNGQIPLWRQAAAGGPVDWQEVYAGYRSSVDFPGAVYWRQITGAFPKAKVIHTVRDTESWYDSARNSIYQGATAPLAPDADPAFKELQEMSREVVWDGLFSGRFTDKDHALRVYHDHDQAIRREIDADRLLVYNIAEGWQPLCDFLGVPVPDQPFPHSNDRAQFTAMVQEQTATGALVSRPAPGCRPRPRRPTR